MSNRGDAVAMPVTDVHNHVIPLQTLEFELAHPECGVSRVDGQWCGPNAPGFPVDPSFHDPAVKLAYLESEGLWAAVVSAPPSHMRYDLSGPVAGEFFTAMNEGFARFCAAAPDRLRWLANLPLPDVDLAVAAYRAALADGCAGVAVGTSIAGARLDEERFEPFWAAVEAAGKPVLIHPAFNQVHPGLSEFYLQNVVGNLLETTLTVERLIARGTFDRFPGVRLVLVHGGGYLPYQLGRLGHAASVRAELAHLSGVDPWRYLDNLVFDTITHDAPALAYLVSRVGAERVVLGTDMPYDMALRRPLDLVVAAGMDPAVLGATAARLFGFDALGVS